MRVRVHDILLLVLVFTLAACSTKPSEDTGRTGQALAPFTTQACGVGSGANVSVSWDDPSSGTTGGGTTDPRPPKIDIVNNTDMTTLYANITLRAIGLGQERTNTIVSGTTLAVPPGETAYTASWGQVPIRSVGTQSALYADVEMVSSSGLTIDRASTPPLYYEYNSAYSQITIYGLDPKDTVGTTPSSYFGLDGTGAVNSTPNGFDDVLANTAASLFTQSGQVWEPNGSSFVSWAPTNTGITTQYGTLPLPYGSWGPMYGDMAFNEVYTSHIVGHYVCSTWRGNFKDYWAGDYANTYGTQEVAARYAPASITDPSGNTVWKGTLDANGCTPLLSRLWGSTTNYTLWQTAAIKTTNNTIKSWIAPIPGPFAFVSGSGYVTVSNSGFTIGTGFRATSAFGTVSLHPAYQDYTTNVMFVLAHAMDRPDNGMIGYSGSPSFQIYSDTGCPGATDTACFEFSSKSAYLAPFINNFKRYDHDAQYKFVIAHLIGHAVQYDGMAGTPGRWDDPDAGDGGLYMGDPSTPELCTCAHIDGGNSAHCLQGKRRPQVAQGEGWANFYAARVWNDQTSGFCEFMNYKRFKDDAGVHGFPEIYDCKVNPVKWLDNHCSVSERGTEYDWMQFESRINTGAADSGLSSITDIEAIYQPCKGTICNWLDLTTSALTRFGSNPSDPRYVKFTNEGNNTGVNH